MYGDRSPPKRDSVSTGVMISDYDISKILTVMTLSEERYVENMFDGERLYICSNMVDRWWIYSWIYAIRRC